MSSAKYLAEITNFGGSNKAVISNVFQEKQEYIYIYKLIVREKTESFGEKQSRSAFVL